MLASMFGQRVARLFAFAIGFVAGGAVIFGLFSAYTGTLPLPLPAFVTNMCLELLMHIVYMYGMLMHESVW
jgi:hypothetical protein